MSGRELSCEGNLLSSFASMIGGAIGIAAPLAAAKRVSIGARISVRIRLSVG
jgi:hypothetical protein